MRWRSVRASIGALEHVKRKRGSHEASAFCLKRRAGFACCVASGILVAIGTRDRHTDGGKSCKRSGAARESRTARVLMGYRAADCPAFAMFRVRLTQGRRQKMQQDEVKTTSTRGAVCSGSSIGVL